ncbi:MAG: hypothetical protein HPY53_01220 [Brevinematales bacterium]|nr:hypothetical protein [Brevinematales bacterium]
MKIEGDTFRKDSPLHVSSDIFQTAYDLSVKLYKGSVGIVDRAVTLQETERNNTLSDGFQRTYIREMDKSAEYLIEKYDVKIVSRDDLLKDLFRKTTDIIVSEVSLSKDEGPVVLGQDIKKGISNAGVINNINKGIYESLEKSLSKSADLSDVQNLMKKMSYDPFSKAKIGGGSSVVGAVLSAMEQEKQSMGMKRNQQMKL